MRRVLFVKADARSRAAVEAALNPQGQEWELAFASRPEAAKHELESSSWDVVVADLASESGRSFFAGARESFPEVVRIGLVHQTPPTLSQLSLVHQYFTVPFDPKEFEVAVERSCRLQSLLRGELIGRTVGALGDLPAVPTVYLQLVEKLNRPDVSVDEVSKIVEGDMGVSAKLLQIANSAMFRTSRDIATVKLAASFLGLDVIKNLVLSTEVFRAFEHAQRPSGFSAEELQAHGHLTAEIAGRMPLPEDTRDAAVLACLLHDIGKLVLAWKMPERFARLMARAREHNQPLYRVEEEMWGVTHAEIGAYLLGLWGLPVSVTEAIAYHHSPGRVPHHRLDALVAVYVANRLAHECDGSPANENDPWDVALLEELGVADQVEEWRGVAEQVAASLKGTDVARTKSNRRARRSKQAETSQVQ